MSLFALDEYYTPTAPAADPEFICTIKSSRIGKKLMVCSISPAPQAALAIAAKAGLPLFVGSEIEQMRDIDNATLDSIVAAKIVAPGCRVVDLVQEGRR